MTRAVLPNRRRSENFDFEHDGCRFTTTVGYAPDGDVAEVFLNSSKLGSDRDSSARDAAISISLALQHGTPLDILRGAVTRNADGSPASPIGRLLDLLQYT
jgi:hypothetical protein